MEEERGERKEERGEGKRGKERERERRKREWRREWREKDKEGERERESLHNCNQNNHHSALAKLQNPYNSQATKKLTTEKASVVALTTSGTRCNTTGVVIEGTAVHRTGTKAASRTTKIGTTLITS